MTKRLKLDEAAENFNREHLAEASAQPEISFEEFLGQVAERQGHVAELKNWENALIEQREELKKRMVVGEDKYFLKLQLTSIDTLISSFTFLLSGRYEFNFDTFSEIERIFSQIAWLVIWCSHAESTETYERTSQMFRDIIEKSNLIAEKNREKLMGKLSEYEKIEKRFQRLRLKRAKVKVAPVIYKRSHFMEVDALIQSGYKHEAAYEKIAKKYGFPWESFARQYRDRHTNEIIKKKKK